jgi:hypothetical protein
MPAMEAATGVESTGYGEKNYRGTLVPYSSHPLHNKTYQLTGLAGLFWNPCLSPHVTFCKTSSVPLVGISMSSAPLPMITLPVYSITRERRLVEAGGEL